MKLWEENDKVLLKLDKAPIPPVVKGIKDMGFKWNSKKQCYIVEKEQVENHLLYSLLKAKCEDYPEEKIIKKKDDIEF